MTKITPEISLQIQTLRDAGLGYKRIGDQLNLKKSTIEKHCRKLKLESEIGPKIKRYRGVLQGRYQLAIKQYLIENPCATLGQIKTALDLPVSCQTLSTYLNRFGIEYHYKQKHK